MNRKHLQAVVRKEFYHVLRDPGTLILLTLGPIFLLLVFVFALTSDIKNVPTAAVDLAKNGPSTELVERLDAADTVHITHHLSDAAETDALFDRGEIRAALVIPENYGVPLAMLTGAVSQMQIIVDGTEPISAEHVLGTIYNTTESHLREILAETFASASPDFDTALLELPINIVSQRRYNPDLRPIVDYYPGLAAMVLSLPGIALTLAVAREHELGTMEQLVATPLSKRALLLGKIIPYLIFGTIDAVVIVGIGQLFFDVPFKGSILGYTLVSFFFMVSNMGLGLFISVLVRSQQLAMIVAFLVFLIPGFFLSGIFFPLWMMPLILQVDLLLLPVTHYVSISKSMYLQGATIGALGFNTVALIVLSIGIVVVSTVVFRKKVV